MHHRLFSQSSKLNKTRPLPTFVLSTKLLPTDFAAIHQCVNTTCRDYPEPRTSSSSLRTVRPRAISLSCDGTSELGRHLSGHLDAARTHCISIFLKALKQIARCRRFGHRIAFSVTRRSSHTGADMDRGALLEFLNKAQKRATAA